MNEHKVIRINLQRGKREFEVTQVGQTIKTRTLEHNPYVYKVVHIDDQDILLERGGKWRER